MFIVIHGSIINADNSSNWLNIFPCIYTSAFVVGERHCNVKDKKSFIIKMVESFVRSFVTFSSHSHPYASIHWQWIIPKKGLMTARSSQMYKKYHCTLRILLFILFIHFFTFLRYPLFRKRIENVLFHSWITDVLVMII